MNQAEKTRLIDNTTHSNSYVVQAALTALGTLAQTDPDVRAAALRNTTHSSWHVVQAALTALGTLAQTDPDVRAAALKVLPEVRADYYEILSKSPHEIPALCSALREGRVDGTTYHGDCGCLLTTLALARGLRYDQLPGITPNSSRPSERFFMKIEKGDTPSTNGFAMLAVLWAEAFE